MRIKRFLGIKAKKGRNVPTLSEQLVVHEKDKKLGGHHATCVFLSRYLRRAVTFSSFPSLGVKESRGPSKHFETEDMDKNPIVVLEFRYRPKGAHAPSVCSR